MMPFTAPLLRSLAEQYGTPLWVYDEASLRLLLERRHCGATLLPAAGRHFNRAQVIRFLLLFAQNVGRRGPPGNWSSMTAISTRFHNSY